MQAPTYPMRPYMHAGNPVPNAALYAGRHPRTRCGPICMQAPAYPMRPYMHAGTCAPNAALYACRHPRTRCGPCRFVLGLELLELV